AGGIGPAAAARDSAAAEPAAKDVCDRHGFAIGKPEFGCSLHGHGPVLPRLAAVAFSESVGGDSVGVSLRETHFLSRSERSTLGSLTRTCSMSLPVGDSPCR